MSTAVRLAAFAAATVAVFVLALLVGRAFAPDEPVAPTPEHGPAHAGGPAGPDRTAPTADREQAGALR